MKETFLKLRIDVKDKTAFENKVGKGKMSTALHRYIERVNATKKKDMVDPHLFI